MSDFEDQVRRVATERYPDDYLKIDGAMGRQRGFYAGVMWYRDLIAGEYEYIIAFRDGDEIMTTGHIRTLDDAQERLDRLTELGHSELFIAKRPKTQPWVEA